MLSWALVTFEKNTKIRLRTGIGCPFGWAKSPSVEIADGMINLWLIMMGMGFAVYDVVYVIKILWTSEHALHF